MEPFLFSLLLLLVSIVSIVSVSLLILFLKHRSNFTGANLPPGTIGYPIIGESLEFLSAGWKGYPEKFIFDRTAKNSTQVFKTSIFGEPVAFFCGAACNKFLFSNENKLVTVWWPSSVNKIFPSSTQTSSQVEASKIRKMLPNFLKAEALMRYIGIMDTIAQRQFATEWDNKKEVLVFPLAKR